MSLSDFLFQGSPPPSVTTYGSTSASLPPWFEDYQKGLLGKSNMVAGESYQPYRLPDQQSFDAIVNSRVAPTTSDTHAGWALGRDAATSYKPTLNSGIAAGQGALGMQTATQASQPGLQGALSMPGAAETAQPYIDQGAMSWPTMANQYMNPFTDQVASRLTDVSNRNLFENILPNVNDNFVKSGMFGSSRQGEFTNRAVRDQNESLMGALSNAYSTAYNQGAQIFGADAGRQLQAGQTMGQLQSTDTQNQLNAANLAGNFANADRTTEGVLSRNLMDMASTQQRLGLTGASIYEGIGAQQQAQTQKGLDAVYNNFVEQRDYPKNQLGFMNNMIRGLQAPTSTSTSASAPASNYNAPPLAQLLGAATGVAGLFGGVKAARGGRINHRRLRGALSRDAEPRRAGGYL